MQHAARGPTPNAVRANTPVEERPNMPSAGNSSGEVANTTTTHRHHDNTPNDVMAPTLQEPLHPRGDRNAVANHMCEAFKGGCDQ